MEIQQNKNRLSLFKLSWPMFIEELTGGITAFTDTLFISMVSDEVAGSVGMLASVLWLGYFIIPQFTSAGTSVSAQYMGAKKEEKVVPTWFANIVISTLMGTLLTIIMLLFSGKIGLMLGMNSVQNEYASSYLSIIVFNFIIVGLRTSYGSILASKGLTHLNMTASMLTNLLNIPLNYVLLTGFWIFPELGIRGIALATVISYLAGFGVIFYFVHVKEKVSFFTENLIKNAKKAAVPILRIGIPAALEPFSYTVQSIIVSAVIVKLGSAAMSANTYVNRFNFLDMAASWSLTMGGQILMSRYLGAGEIDKVRKTYWKIAAIICSFAFIVYLSVVLFANFFMSLFTKDPLIISLSIPLLFIALAMEPIRAVNVLGGVALKTAGDGKFSVIISLVFMWGLVPVLIACVALGGGIFTVWMCLLADETIRAIINIWRWRSGRWIGRRVIDEKKEEN